WEHMLRCAASCPASSRAGRSSQLTSPRRVFCTVSPLHTPLHSEPSPPAHEPCGLLAGITQAAGMRATKMTANASTATSAIQTPRFTSACVQDQRGVHHAGLGLLDGGRVDGDAMLLGQAVEPGDHGVPRRLL